METIRQSIIFDCPAHAFYEAFLDADEHAEITGSDAIIDARIGGEYSGFDGELSGEFELLVPDRLIEMKWRSNMVEWPEDHYARARFELLQSSDGTTLEFELSNVPSELAGDIEQGWNDLYWEPLQKRFAW